MQTMKALAEEQTAGVFRRQLRSELGKQFQIVLLDLIGVRADKPLAADRSGC
jgi:hypothetical protein